MIPIAVAIACGDVGAPTFVDLSKVSLHNAARVVLPNTIVVDVADAIAVRIGHAVASADAKDVKLVPVAIAVASRDVGASALVDLSGPIADAARVVLSDTMSSSDVAIGHTPPHAEHGCPANAVASGMLRTALEDLSRAIRRRWQSSSTSQIAIVATQSLHTPKT